MEKIIYNGVCPKYNSVYSFSFGLKSNPDLFDPKIKNTCRICDTVLTNKDAIKKIYDEKGKFVKEETLKMEASIGLSR